MRWTSLFEKKNFNNATQVTGQLLHQLHVPVTATTIANSLESHPDFPSLYSISDALKKWKVSSTAFQVEGDHLAELPAPFISHLKTSGGLFCVVTGVEKETVSYIAPDGSAKEKSKEAFLKDWSGIVLLAETSLAGGEKTYSIERRKEIVQNARIPFIVACCLCLIAVYMMRTQEGDPGWLFPILAILKLTGSVVAGLLLWAEIGKANPVLQQICSSTKNTNCGAVLASKAARLFNLFSWSEIGFVYFTGGFLFLLSSANTQLSTISLLAWLNVMALPYTIFSISYQWKSGKAMVPALPGGAGTTYTGSCRLLL